MQDTLKMGAEGFSEILVAVYQTTKFYNLEDCKKIA